MGRLPVLGLLTLLALPSRAPAQEPPAARPNVLLLVIEDLNDWNGPLGGSPRALTPNLDRLARGGVTFRNAHCPVPSCNASRTATLTGVPAHESGIYHSSRPPFRSVLPDVVTLPQYFKTHGYESLGAGKVFHASFPDPVSWDDYFPAMDRTRPQDPTPPKGALPANGIDGLRGLDWASLDVPVGSMGDRRVANWVGKQLEVGHGRPLLLACGFFRTHWPWYVPGSYFEPYPPDAVTLPEVREGDLDDLSEAARRCVREPVDWHPPIRDAGKWKEGVRAYLAAITFVDEQVGRVLDALESGPLAGNTIVVLWSDHGLHLGEKEHWGKFSPWEESTRVPLLISGPGVPKGVVCDAPVSLMDLYPTVVELAGLPAPTLRAGRSLVPWMEDPAREREEPALTSVGQGSHTVRSRDWRYVRWADGSEELYDHRVDPHEWTNLAGRAEHAAVQRELAGWIPAKSAAERGED